MSRVLIPAVGFIALIVCFAAIANYFAVSVDLPTALSFILLLAPYWAFGFGIDKLLLRRLHQSPFPPLVLLIPYLVFALPTHHFRRDMFLGMTALVLVISFLLQQAHRANPATPD
jgi:hypothetical protein